jgi:hypothetical protein
VISNHEGFSERIFTLAKIFAKSNVTQTVVVLAFNTLDDATQIECVMLTKVPKGSTTMVHFYLKNFANVYITS